METDAARGSEETRPDVAACESCPGRTVFVENGNSDGWIASDLTVEPRR